MSREFENAASFLWYGSSIRDTKNPQRLAQRCFVASFESMFRVFTLRDQLVAHEKHLLQAEET